MSEEQYTAKGRKLRLKARAERMQETRQRIIQAAYELHATLGPARTTISAIAERAGVQRLTVYHHFPDEITLALACTGYGFATDPLPDPARWSEIADPEVRLRTALAEVYGYHRRNEMLWTNVLRDAPLMPLEVTKQVGDLIQPFFDLPVRGRDVLAVGWRARNGQDMLLAALGAALEFQMWRALARQGLDDERAIILMVGLVRAWGEVAVAEVAQTPLSPS